jgi:hypothetical protein
MNNWQLNSLALFFVYFLFFLVKQAVIMRYEVILGIHRGL